MHEEKPLPNPANGSLYFCLLSVFSTHAHTQNSNQPDTTKLGRYIDSITDQMVHRNEYDEFSNFFQGKPSIFNTIQQTVQQSLETIHINTEWQERNYENIGRLLTEY